MQVKIFETRVLTFLLAAFCLAACFSMPAYALGVDDITDALLQKAYYWLYTNAEDDPESTTLVCPNCGNTVTFNSAMHSNTCSECGESMVLEDSDGNATFHAGGGTTDGSGTGRFHGYTDSNTPLISYRGMAFAGYAEPYSLYLSGDFSSDTTTIADNTIALVTGENSYSYSCGSIYGGDGYYNKVTYNFESTVSGTYFFDWSDFVVERTRTVASSGNLSSSTFDNDDLKYQNLQSCGTYAAGYTVSFANQISGFHSQNHSTYNETATFPRIPVYYTPYQTTVTRMTSITVNNTQITANDNRKIYYDNSTNNYYYYNDEGDCTVYYTDNSTGDITSSVTYNTTNNTYDITIYNETSSADAVEDTSGGLEDWQYLLDGETLTTQAGNFSWDSSNKTYGDYDIDSVLASVLLDAGTYTLEFSGADSMSLVSYGTGSYNSSSKKVTLSEATKVWFQFSGTDILPSDVVLSITTYIAPSASDPDDLPGDLEEVPDGWYAKAYTRNKEEYFGVIGTADVGGGNGFNSSTGSTSRSSLFLEIPAGTWNIISSSTGWYAKTSSTGAGYGSYSTLNKTGSTITTSELTYYWFIFSTADYESITFSMYSNEWISATPEPTATPTVTPETTATPEPTATAVPSGSDDDSDGDGDDSTTNPFSGLLDLLGGILSTIISLLWKLIGALLSFILWLLSLLGSLVPWLPSECVVALSAGVVIVLVIRIIKFIL